jgi:hypothetical protein
MAQRLSVPRKGCAARRRRPRARSCALCGPACRSVVRAARGVVPDEDFADEGNEQDSRNHAQCGVVDERHLAQDRASVTRPSGHLHRRSPTQAAPQRGACFHVALSILTAPERFAHFPWVEGGPQGRRRPGRPAGRRQRRKTACAGDFSGRAHWQLRRRQPGVECAGFVKVESRDGGGGLL